MSHNLKLRLDIVVTDKDGRVTERRTVESDILLRNALCRMKVQWLANNLLVAGDGQRDVNNNQVQTQGTTAIRGMTGTGVTVETSADFRIQTPLYTLPDTTSVSTVTLGVGNQVTLAITSAHTFAGGATVTEAGLVDCAGSTVTYLTNANFQFSRNTFAGVVVGIGGTFTSTYTLTTN